MNITSSFPGTSALSGSTSVIQRDDFNPYLPASCNYDAIIDWIKLSQIWRLLVTKCDVMWRNVCDGHIMLLDNELVTDS